MRIAQLVSLQESVPPRGKNGLEYMVHYLTEELVRRGHEVTLFATSDSVTSARLIEVLPYPMSKGVLFNLTPTHYALTVAAKAVEMSAQFDIIHSHLGAPLNYFSNLTDTPLIETVHSASRVSSRAQPETFLKKYCADRQARFYRIHHVYVSSSQRRNFDPRRNCSVVHNGIAFEDFTFRPQAGEYLAYLGYLTENKGAHLAVRAARKTGVKLKLAGSYYGCEEYFKKEIQPYLRRGQIEYVGVLAPQARNEFLGRASALLFPIAWEEPFGLVMIEAMACGTPVIGFDRAAVPEVVRDGVTGFVVADGRGLERSIGKIASIARPDCRKHVEKNFSVSKMADNYEKLYAKIIARHKQDKLKK